MDLVLVGFSYLIWHYSAAVKKLVQIWLNFVWFVAHFFSLKVLLRTLFSPWRRLDEGYKKGLEPKAWVDTLIVNVLMRAVGFIIRLIFIVIGCVVLLLVTVSLVPALIIWLILPPLLVALFVSGLVFIFK